MATVGDVIRIHRDEILRDWGRQAARVTSARGLEQQEVDSVLRAYLDAVSDEGPAEERRSVRLRLVEAHASARLRQGFQVEEVLAEVALLGICILRATPAADWPEPAEVDALLTEVERASVLVAHTFERHMREAEQTEKRYLRLVEQAARQTFLPDASVARERLTEVLLLVMEAMDAQSAALLLLDADRHRLITAASAGVASQALEDDIASLDPETFLGKVASTGEQPTEVLDVRRTALRVSERLRRSGINALLGVRLPRFHSLTGVLYVGLSVAREFTGAERARLETLGEQLGIQLDNAKLYRELQATVTSLEAERVLRERFVAALAPDLRGPLAAAKRAAERLLDRPEPRDGRVELAERITANLERIDRASRELLEAGRLQSGGPLPLRLGTADLVALVEEVVDEVGELNPGRLVLVASQAVAGTWSADELRRALWNLLSTGARYATPERPLTVTVSRDDQAARVRLQLAAPPPLPVPAPGEGPADLGSCGSWGLGLLLARGIARAHAGSLEIEGPPSAGGAVTLELPLDASRHPPAPGAAEASLPA